MALNWGATVGLIVGCSSWAKKASKRQYPLASTTLPSSKDESSMSLPTSSRNELPGSLKQKDKGIFKGSYIIWNQGQAYVTALHSGDKIYLCWTAAAYCCLTAVESPTAEWTSEGETLICDCERERVVMPCWSVWGLPRSPGDFRDILGPRKRCFQIID